MFNRYYEDELAFLREMGAEFARANPAAAPFLAERGADPDVERLLEGFAFLAIGRPETEGCYCKVNDFLRVVIEGLAARFDYVIIDGEEIDGKPRPFLSTFIWQDGDWKWASEAYGEPLD